MCGSGESDVFVKFEEAIRDILAEYEYGRDVFINLIDQSLAQVALEEAVGETFGPTVEMTVGLDGTVSLCGLAEAQVRSIAKIWKKP